MKLLLLCCNCCLETWAFSVFSPIPGEEGASLQKRKSSAQKCLMNKDFEVHKCITLMFLQFRLVRCVVKSVTLFKKLLQVDVCVLFYLFQNSYFCLRSLKL